MNQKKIFGKPSVLFGIEDMEVSRAWYYYSEVDVTFRCSMDFATFPFDEQLCLFKMTSYESLPIEEFLLTNIGVYLSDMWEPFSPTDKDYDYQVII